MNVQDVIARAGEDLSVKRVFGEPYEKNGVTVIPAAKVQGGAGGGVAPEEEGKGSGGGFGVTGRPVGAFLIRGDKLTWQPAIDVNRIALGGQVVGVVALLVLRSIVRARSRAQKEQPIHSAA
jgi:uncharacterized spore protein YtfJ